MNGFAPPPANVNHAQNEIKRLLGNLQRYRDRLLDFAMRYKAACNRQTHGLSYMASVGSSGSIVNATTRQFLENQIEKNVKGIQHAKAMLRRYRQPIPPYIHSSRSSSFPALKKAFESAVEFNEGNAVRTMERLSLKDILSAIRSTAFSSKLVPDCTTNSRDNLCTFIFSLFGSSAKSEGGTRKRRHPKRTHTRRA